MSSKLTKWLFDIISGRHERNWREFSVPGFIFTYVQKYFSGPHMGAGGDRPHLLPHQWRSNGVGRVDNVRGPAECRDLEFQAKMFKSNFPIITVRIRTDFGL